MWLVVVTTTTNSQPHHFPLVRGILKHRPIMKIFGTCHENALMKSW